MVESGFDCVLLLSQELFFDVMGRWDYSGYVSCWHRLKGGYG